jgi:CRISPR-associated protein Cas5t
LLSFVGETDLTTHLGVKLAIGVVGEEPTVSRIVRKQRHHKFSKKHLGTYPSSQFSKPNLQEILTDLQLVIRVDSSEETGTLTLEERIVITLETPEKINRFGGLSLGESWALVNGIRFYREGDGSISWLVKDKRGLISLPIWIDRKTTRGTFQRFSLSETNAEFSELSWVNIHLPR